MHARAVFVLAKERPAQSSFISFANGVCMKTDIILETKVVGEVSGLFYVPSYQRGYRWGKQEIKQLLDDICQNGSRSYCLQPVAVKKKGEKYELIDGQQRLTTIYILLQYMKAEYEPKIDLKYKLEYETRDGSGEYLANICNKEKSETNKQSAETNVDFYHIYNACKTIDEWFQSVPNDDAEVAVDIYGYLVKNVKIIWYEVPEDEDGISLFTRLNIGRIPLTSAELVKAAFLSRDIASDIGKEKRQEISLQWDNIERELHDEKLWCFLANQNAAGCQTRIDLVLDLFSEKNEKERDKYYTFFAINEMKSRKPLNDIWREIQLTFLALKDWFEDHDYYHKIGYLIASQSMTLQGIYKESKGKTKNEFREALNNLIRDSIIIKINGKESDKNYSELDYNKGEDKKYIHRLLLLFNIESVRQNGENTEWFPFEKYKIVGDKKDNRWSLEHINAQQEHKMKTRDIWKEWLRLHMRSVEAVSAGSNQSELIEEMQAAIGNNELEAPKFEDLYAKTIGVLGGKGSDGRMHAIGNLALLDSAQNSALSNSAFDVKRNKIIEMDQNGQFIPFCTKMAFLKYYTPSDENQLHFWGEPDRKAYINAINDKLKLYLKQPISLSMEDA